MTDHDCRGCKHIGNNSSEVPCKHCRRVHRIDKYEMIQVKTETWYQCVPSLTEKHYNRKGERLGLDETHYWWWEPFEVTLIE